MSAGDVLNEVKLLCKEKKYEEAKILIESNKELLEDKFSVAQQFIDLKQASILERFKSFFGVNE